MSAPFRAALVSTYAVILSTLTGTAVALAAGPAHAEATPGPVDQLPQVVHGAHRGGALEGPEGTLESMDAAVAAGVDVLDLDLRSLADGELAVSHDRNAVRLTTASAAVARLDADQWLGLDVDARAWFGRVPEDVAPVTFPEVLSRYADKVVLLAELKRATSLPRAAEEIRAVGAEGSVVLQSNDPAVVQQIHEAGLHAGLWRSPAQVADDDTATWVASGAEQVVLQSETPTDLVDKAVASGLPVWVCGINRRDLVQPLLDRGVRGVLSDAPAYTFGSTDSRRVLPLTQSAGSLTLKRGTVGEVTGRVVLPALGDAIPHATVAVSIDGKVVRATTDETGRFSATVTAPSVRGNYRIYVASRDLTVQEPGAALDRWAVKGTARIEGTVPRLTVTR